MTFVTQDSEYLRHGRSALFAYHVLLHILDSQVVWVHVHYINALPIHVLGVVVDLSVHPWYPQPTQLRFSSLDLPASGVKDQGRAWSGIA